VIRVVITSLADAIVVEDVGTVIVILQDDVELFRKAEVKFRNDVVAGPGGRQILLEDPSGNLVELFEPAPESVK